MPPSVPDQEQAPAAGQALATLVEILYLANLLLRGLLPILLLGGGLIYAAWRRGRLYCGWVRPHFSVVELINRLMRRASGKPSPWQPRPGQADAQRTRSRPTRCHRDDP
jgi:hypothetical protein